MPPPTIAAELEAHDAVEVILIGGRIYKHSMVAVGPTALAAIDRLRPDVFFLGATRDVSSLAQTLGTVVLEAALRSGALISARLAAEAGREVFALPGSVDNPVARGCHRLIRDGATLVENPDQVIEALEPLAASLAADLRSALGPLQTPAGEPTGTPNGRSAGGQPGDTADPKRLWSARGHAPTPVDVEVPRTGLTVAELSSMLLVMELDGRVVADNGRFARHP